MKGSGKYLPYLLATALQAGSQFLTIPLLTRNLSQAEFGDVTLILSLSIFLGILLALGVPGAVTRIYFFGENGREIATRFSRSIVIAQSVLAALFFLACFMASESGRPRIWLLGVTLAIVNGSQQTVLALVRSRRRPFQYLLLSSLFFVVPPAVAIVHCLLTNYSVSTYAGTLAVVGLSVSATCGVALTRKVPVSLQFSDYRSAFAFGLPLVPHGVGIALFGVGDRFVVSPMLGSGAVGRYQIAALIGSGMIALLGAVNNVVAPSLYGTEPEDRALTLSLLSRRVLHLAVHLAILVGCISPYVISILAPPSYGRHDLALLTLIICISPVPYAIYQGNVHGFFLEGRSRPLAWSTPVALGVTLGLVVAFTYALGIVGTSIASVLGYCVLAMTTALVRRRFVGKWSVDVAHVPSWIALAIGFLALMSLWVFEVEREWLLTLPFAAVVTWSFFRTAPAHVMPAASTSVP